MKRVKRTMGKFTMKRMTAILLLLLLLFPVTMQCAAAKQSKKDAKEKTIESVDDLEGSNIGVQLGTTGDIYASDYEGDDAGTKVTRFNKGADAVQALKQKKIDCVLIDEQPAKAFVEKNPDLTILKEEFAVEDYAICVSKKNPELRDKINQALDELKKDGTLSAIIDNYIGENAGKNPYKLDENSATHDLGTLVMATNVGFPPYEYYENGKATGIDVDMATAVADKLGMDLKVSDMEFDSIIVAVQSGKADVGVAGITVTDERKKNVDFTDSYTTAKQVIIVRNGSSQSSVGLIEKIKSTFLDNANWKYIPKGLLNTLIITIFAGLCGIILGFLLAIIRVAHDRNEEKTVVIRVLNTIARLYLTIFRGTPMMVQLLIMYYVIFAKVDVNPVVAAVIAFGLNSGAYVAEAIRAGIISIPIGQFEAGRSLGFNYGKTMRYIILPQAVKNALPAMCNEFIALLKESSIVGYIGLMDLTKAGDIIRSNTYEAMIPLLSVALVYLVIVIILTSLVGRLERRLKKDAR